MALSDRPKIVLIGGDGLPSGVPRHIQHLAQALQDDAYITVVSDRDRGGYTALQSLNIGHVVIHGLTNRGLIRRPFHRLRQLMQLLRDEKPDLVWVHPRLLVLLLRIAWALRLWQPDHPVLFTLHGLPFGPGHRSRLQWLIKLVERTLISVGPPQDLVFLDHRSSGKIAHELDAKRLARHRVHVLPNCSDLRPLPPNRTARLRHLVMTGRTGWQKDYEWAARQFAALPSNYHLTLCGGGTNCPKFQSHIAELIPPQAFARIDFRGPVPDVRPILQTAHAYMLTSRYEGTPIGALEAFEAGLPIILRHFDGAPELIARHPFALMIGDRWVEDDALRIVRYLHRFEQNRYALEMQTKAVWQERWSPQVFARNARALVQSVCGKALLRSAQSDFDRDIPALLPDRRRTSDARAPAPPPSYTDAAPSPENA